LCANNSQLTQTQWRNPHELKGCEKVLLSLTDDFENIVCATEELRNLEEMTIANLDGSLEPHEQQKKKKK